MAAPKGNEFWKMRSKHGRDKLFADPELLWDAACDFFRHIDNNPWQRIEQVKTQGKPFRNDDGELEFPPNTVSIPTARPYTIQGLCLYLSCNKQYFDDFEQALKKDNPVDQDFSLVITRIRETIYTQKFEGAAVGAFNASIIARDLGLADKTDNKNDNTNRNYKLTMNL
jgi:hypothetical protein